MLPRPPEIQSFTKFLLSAGTFLCIAAVLLPGFVLRDTSVLRLSRKQLSGLTPVARAELERRQRLARDLGGAAIYVTGGLLIVGCVLIGIALPSMRRKEQADDALAAASLDKLLAEIRPQTRTERETELASDATVVVTPGDVVARRPLVPGSHAPDPIRRAAEIEERALERIAAIAPTERYQVMPNVSVGARPRGLLLDGLLVGRRPEWPDVVVEIKSTTPHNVLKLADNGFQQLLAQMVRYRAHTRRLTAGWLLVVAQDDVEDRHLARISTLNKELTDPLVKTAVTAIRERDIATLRIPDVLLR